MTTPDATRCPQCRAVLTGREACSGCGLRLTGPEAARLWDVDSELLALDAARVPLLAERSALLAALRGTPAPAPAAEVPAARVPEVAPRRVQNVLLGLGGLLLAVAALVFAAVTYERLGAGGRAAVLLALTAGAAAAVPVAVRRGLSSTAETLTAVALVLAGLDAFGLRRLGVGDGLGASAYTAVSAGVLSVLAGAYAAAVPVRLAGWASVGLAQLVLPGLLVEQEASAPTAAAVLALQAGLDVGAAALLRRRAPAVAAVATSAVALAVGLVAAFDRAEDAGRGALALLLLAAVLAAAAAVTARLRVPLAASAVVLLGVAAHAVARGELTEPQEPLVAAALALLAVQGAALLPRALRAGPVLGGLLVVAGALAAVAEPLAQGLLGPLLWVLEPWTAVDGATARDALSPSERWDGTVVTPVVLAAAALACVGAGLALHRLRAAVLPAAALGAAAALLLPLGLDLPLLAGLLLLLALAAGACLVGRLPVTAAAGVLVVLAAAWSLADRTATLAVLPLGALLAGAVALRAGRGEAAALAGLLASGTVAAVGAAAGLSVDQVGALLVPVTGALLAGAVPAVGPARRTGLEAAAACTAVGALAAASGDAGWTSWSLAGLALVALAGALRPDRRPLAVAGGLLLSASSWVRLADAGVGAPEPYVAPLAVVALVLGHLRRRAVPATGSFAAYGPGLTALLLPSLLASLAGSPLWRPLVLGAVALAVVLAGVRERLRAPLVVGGAVLAVDAVLLLAPYAAALPRWLALGSAGLLLVVVGATYERRLQELARLRSRFDALA